MQPTALSERKRADLWPKWRVTRPHHYEQTLLPFVRCVLLGRQSLGSKNATRTMEAADLDQINGFGRGLAGCSYLRTSTECSSLPWHQENATVNTRESKIIYHRPRYDSHHRGPQFGSRRMKSKLFLARMFPKEQIRRR
jgi:hypothetical protein